MPTKQQKKNQPVFTVEKVTPEIAGDWLNANTHNRHLRNRAVNKLLGIIERGEWVMNGEAIKFDVDGTLQDGQHRLWAIHLSGQTVETLVGRNLPVEGQATLDTGERRNLADQLRMPPYNQGNAVMLAAMVNMKWQIDNNLVRTSYKPTVQQGLTLFNEHPGLADCKTLGQRWHKRLGGSTSGVATLYYEFSNVDSDAAEVFFDHVIDGIGLTEGSPELALRRAVELSRPGTVMLVALTIKAWNAYMQGKKVERLMWRPVGTKAEVFPTIYGKTDYVDSDGD